MQHQLCSDRLTVTLDTFGAELLSIKNSDGLEYIWQADKNVWPRHAPVLFPIVGKLKDNSYHFENKSYQLTQHGFARDLPFTLSEQTEQACVFELRSTDETYTKYPFSFILKVIYQLEKNKLTTTYSLFNPSGGIIFFNIGAHPGFNCPLLPDETFEDYYLEFNDTELFTTQLSEGLRTSVKNKLEHKKGKIFLSGTLFDNDALVFENKQIDKVRLRSSRSEHSITLDCKDWPYFGVWSKKGCREFVCLEPWFGITDGVDATQILSSKDGIIQLQPKKEFRCSFTICID